MTTTYPYPSIAIADLEIPESHSLIQSKLKEIAQTNGNQSLDTAEEYYRATKYLTNLKEDRNHFQIAGAIRKVFFQHVVADFHHPENSIEGDSETKFCHEQILGCDYHENSIYVISEEEQTIYEYHLGVDDYTSHDNIMLTRRDVLSGEVVAYVLDDPDLEYIHSLGTDGKNIFGLVKSRSNVKSRSSEGLVVGKFFIGSQTAEIHFHTMNRRDSGYWRYPDRGGGVQCSHQDFFRGTDDHFYVECRGFGDRWRRFDLTANPFTDSASQMVPLNRWQDEHWDRNRKGISDLVSQHGSFKDFLIWCVGVYTDGNKHNTADVGIANLREELDGHMRPEDILILAAVINNLSEIDKYQDSIDSKKTKETLADIDEDALIAFALRCNETYLKNFPKEYAPYYDNEFDDLVNGFRSGQADSSPLADPVMGLVNPGVNVNRLPEYNYKSPRELLDAHLGFFTDVEFPDDLFDIQRSSWPFHCDFSKRPAYREFAESDQNRFLGRPFSDAQLNVILAFIAGLEWNDVYGDDDDYYTDPQESQDADTQVILNIAEKREVLDSMDAEDILDRLNSIIDRQQEQYAERTEKTLYGYGQAINAIADLEALRFYFENLVP